MNKIRTVRKGIKVAGMLLLGILFSAILTGCGQRSGAAPEDEQETKERQFYAAMKEIEEALQEQGYTTAYKEVEDGWFQGEGHRIILNDDLDSQVVCYVYETTGAARKDMNCIDKTGYHITIDNGLLSEQMIVDWISVPHFYQYQNLLVQYVGQDETVLNVLKEICGDYFAGGDLS